MKLVIRLAAIALLITGVIVFCVCASPVRWDIKSLGQVIPQFEAPGLEPDTNVLFVSCDNGWENGHYVQYGLDMVTFPKGKFQWMIFKEGDRGGYAWPANWMIDQAGRLSRAGSDQVWPSTAAAPDDLRSFVESGCVIVRSADKASLLERWPELTQAKILTIKAGASRFIELPRLRITPGQCLRMFLPVFLLVVALAFGGWMSKGDHSAARRLLNLGLAFPGVLVIHTTLVYLLGNITSNATSTALIIEILGAIGILAYMCLKSPERSRSVQKHTSDVANRRIFHRLLLAGAAILFVSASMLRLDFDGDMFTQYLPVARFHNLEGRHDPDALKSRYGVMTQATYPPGFPILISTLMWVSGVKKSAPVGFNYETNLMVFLYRLVFTILHLSFLVAVGALFRTLAIGRLGFTWLLPVVMIPLVLPLFLGQPGAAEVYLVPLIGFSIVALYAAAGLNQPLYIHIGLFIGAAGLFIKKEGLIIFCLIVLTWYVADRLRSGGFSFRATASHIATAVIGLSPFLVWKFKLGDLAANEYFFYERPSVGKLVASWALLGKIAEKAMKILLANNYWVVLLLMLPLVMAYGGLLRLPWREQLVPLGILLYIGAMTCVFVFSQHPGGPIEHMEVSYDRLMTTPVLAAILYGAKVFSEIKVTLPDNMNA